MLRKTKRWIIHIFPKVNFFREKKLKVSSHRSKSLLPMTKVIILPILAIFLAISTRLAVTNFAINKVVVVSAQAKLKGLNLLNGKSLYFLDEDSISKKLLNNNPEIAEILIQKVYPRTLILNTKVRQPLAEIKNYNSPLFKKAYLDKNGVLFFYQDMGGIPSQIEIIGKLTIGGTEPDWRMKLLANIIQALSGKGIFVDHLSVNIKDGLVDILINEGINIKTNFEINPGILAGSLQIILHRFRIEGKKIMQISFLYDKPIVTLDSGEIISST